mmetsp:Transcript_29552/g.95400  ORF Transcript_29552/g.95400 Transcript_29552/m.95400 type:complete len:236 (-) Transcript_29552:1029-1736(-)
MAGGAPSGLSMLGEIAPSGLRPKDGPSSGLRPGEGASSGPNRGVGASTSAKSARASSPLRSLGVFSRRRPLSTAASPSGRGAVSPPRVAAAVERGGSPASSASSCACSPSALRLPNAGELRHPPPRRPTCRIGSGAGRAVHPLDNHPAAPPPPLPSTPWGASAGASRRVAMVPACSGDSLPCRTIRISTARSDMVWALLACSKRTDSRRISSCKRFRLCMSAAGGGGPGSLGLGE